MDIILADEAGYCFGVKNAIEITDKTLLQASPVYAFGELSHNRQEMQRLKKQGLILLEDFPEKLNGSVIIRTHGVSQETLEKLKKSGLTIINATCPYVKSLQQKIKKYDQEGYQIVIVGNKDHPEVKGACGWAHKTPIVIETVEQALKLKDLEKICLLAQTTIIESKFNKIAQVLKNNTRDILIFNTICSATANRQKAAADLAQRVDGMIVVGGYHSSNTQKLYEICKAHCKNTWHVETAKELDLKALREFESVGITAGASTPNWLIKEVMEAMDDSKINEVVETEEQTLEQEENIEPVEDVQESVIEESQPVEEVVVEEVPPTEETETVVEVESSPEVIAEEDVIKQEEPTNEEVTETGVEVEVTEEANPLDTEAEDEDFDFAKMIDNLKPVRRNSVIEGEVIDVSEDEVILNIGYKSDAVIYKRDYTWQRDENLQNLVEIGEKVTGIVTDLNDGEGRVKLSKIKYDNQQIQERLGRAYENKEVLYGKVKDVSGSGLVVDVGFADIFMPASQYNLHYVKDLKSLLGKDVRGLIIDYNPKRRRAILSQRVLLAEERKQRQEEHRRLKEARFNELNLDDIVSGKVKTITDFGVFVDLNGIDGFIHRSDLTWERNNEPKNIVKKDQEIEAKVISKNEKDKKIKLSVKALQEKPWDKFLKQYAENDEIDVIITNTLDFGAFAQIIPGVEGLIHISEISYDRVESVDSVIKTGETVKVKIIGINKDKEKISLSMKATLPRPERISRPRFQENEEFDNYRENRKSNRENRRRQRRRDSNKNRMVYEESADFTLGDSFGNLFDGLNFNYYDDEYDDYEEDIEENVIEEEPVEEDVQIETVDEEIENPVLNQPIEGIELPEEEVTEETIESTEIPEETSEEVTTEEVSEEE